MATVLNLGRERAEEEEEQVQEEDASDEKEDGHGHGDEEPFSQSKAQNIGTRDNKQKLGAIRHALLDLHRCLHSLQVFSHICFILFLIYFFHFRFKASCLFSYDFHLFN